MIRAVDARRIRSHRLGATGAHSSPRPTFCAIDKRLCHRSGIAGRWGLVLRRDLTPGSTSVDKAEKNVVWFNAPHSETSLNGREWPSRRNRPMTPIRRNQIPSSSRRRQPSGRRRVEVFASETTVRIIRLQIDALDGRGGILVPNVERSSETSDRARLATQRRASRSARPAIGRARMPFSFA